MYDYRNPIAAGYAGMPWHYAGGLGDIFFSDHVARIASGLMIKDLTVQRRRELFHTRIDLPISWTYWPSGLIVPDCYIDYKRLEALFRSPKGVLAFMYQSKEKEMAEDAICGREFIKDMGEKDLRYIAKDLGRAMFGKEYVIRLTDKEKIQNTCGPKDVGVSLHVFNQRFRQSDSSGQKYFGDNTLATEINWKTQT